MKKHEVPQDESKALDGRKKPLYVINENGEYTTQLSSGWEAEEIVLNQAIAQFETNCSNALQRVQQGLSAPLEYHMYHRRMDITVLAQSTGFYQWQIKRHFHPQRFSRLSEKKQARYAEALGLTAEELQSLPSDLKATHDST